MQRCKNTKMQQPATSAEGRKNGRAGRNRPIQSAPCQQQELECSIAVNVKMHAKTKLSGLLRECKMPSKSEPKTRQEQFTQRHRSSSSWWPIREATLSIDQLNRWAKTLALCHLANLSLRRSRLELVSYKKYENAVQGRKTRARR